VYDSGSLFLYIAVVVTFLLQIFYLATANLRLVAMSGEDRAAVLSQVGKPGLRIQLLRK
jgi:hypothetical protein